MKLSKKKVYKNLKEKQKQQKSDVFDIYFVNQQHKLNKNKNKKTQIIQKN